MMKSSRFVLHALLQAVVLPLILTPFLYAGAMDWPMGWALLTTFIFGIIGTRLLNILQAPELARELYAPRGVAERWDPFLTNAAKILFFEHIWKTGLCSAACQGISNTRGKCAFGSSQEFGSQYLATGLSKEREVTKWAII